LAAIQSHSGLPPEQGPLLRAVVQMVAGHFLLVHDLVMASGCGPRPRERGEQGRVFNHEEAVEAHVGQADLRTGLPEDGPTGDGLRLLGEGQLGQLIEVAHRSDWRYTRARWRRKVFPEETPRLNATTKGKLSNDMQAKNRFPPSTRLIEVQCRS
jgi:hypothetical protein